MLNDLAEEPQGWFNSETGQWDLAYPSMPAFSKDDS